MSFYLHNSFWQSIRPTQPDAKQSTSSSSSSSSSTDDRVLSAAGPALDTPMQMSSPTSASQTTSSATLNLAVDQAPTPFQLQQRKKEIEVLKLRIALKSRKWSDGPTPIVSKIAYTDRVKSWFANPIHTLLADYRTAGIIDVNYRAETIWKHRFTTEIDSYVLENKHGVKIFNPQNGDCYYLPALIQKPGQQPQRVEFQYTFGANGQCYHRACSENYSTTAPLWNFIGPAKQTHIQDGDTTITLFQIR